MLRCEGLVANLSHEEYQNLFCVAEACNFALSSIYNAEKQPVVDSERIEVMIINVCVSSDQI